MKTTHIRTLFPIVLCLAAAVLLATAAFAVSSDPDTAPLGDAVCFGILPG